MLRRLYRLRLCIRRSPATLRLSQSTQPTPREPFAGLRHSESLAFGVSHMPSAPSLSSLPPDRKRLVKLMQVIHFGRIENLTVRGGHPVFDGSPLVIRTLRIAGMNEPRKQ